MALSPRLVGTPDARETGRVKWIDGGGCYAVGRYSEITPEDQPRPLVRFLPLIGFKAEP